MKTQLSPWTRLVRLARHAPDDPRDTAAPAGFATRVCALAFAAPEPSFATLFSRFAPRALTTCGLLMFIGVSLNLGSVLQALESESSPLNDPVAEWLDAAT